jgi:hypothetical protein
LPIFHLLATDQYNIYNICICILLGINKSEKESKKGKLRGGRLLHINRPPRPVTPITKQQPIAHHDEGPNHDNHGKHSLRNCEQDSQSSPDRYTPIHIREPSLNHFNRFLIF